MRNQYKVIDNNDINRSFNSNPHSKLSSNMNIKNQKKKIHSHCLNDFEKIKFNNKAILENGIKEIPLPSTIINTKQDPSKSDYENLIPKKPLLENLDYDQYKEIEEELNVLKEIQSVSFVANSNFNLDSFGILNSDVNPNLCQFDDENFNYLSNETNLLRF